MRPDRRCRESGQRNILGGSQVRNDEHGVVADAKTGGVHIAVKFGCLNFIIRRGQILRNRRLEDDGLGNAIIQILN